MSVQHFGMHDCSHSHCAVCLPPAALQAPELLRNGRMSPSADVYSFGIVSEFSPSCRLQQTHKLPKDSMGQAAHPLSPVALSQGCQGVLLDSWGLLGCCLTH